MVSGLGESLGSQMPRGRARTLEHDAFSGAGGESPGQFEGRSHFGQKNLPKSPCYLRRYTSSIKKGTPHLEGKVRDTSRHTGPKKGIFATVPAAHMTSRGLCPPPIVARSHPGQNSVGAPPNGKWAGGIFGLPNAPRQGTSPWSRCFFGAGGEFPGQF